MVYLNPDISITTVHEMPQLKGKDYSTGIIKTNNRQKQLHAFYKVHCKTWDIEWLKEKDGKTCLKKAEISVMILEKI